MESRLIESIHKRIGHIVVSSKNYILVWSGFVNEKTNRTVQSTYCSTDIVWFYDCINGMWKPAQTTGNIPPTTSGSSAAVLDDHLYIFGGMVEFSDDHMLRHRNDLYRLHLPSLVWEKLSPRGPKPPHSDKGVGWAYDGKLYFFGGYGPRPDPSAIDFVFQADITNTNGRMGWNNNFFAYDPVENAWFKPNTRGRTPDPRAAHSASIVGNRAFIFGGRLGETRTNDIYFINLDTLTWSQNVNSSTRSRGPEGRSWLSFNFVSRKKAVVYGGLRQYGITAMDYWECEFSDNYESLEWTKCVSPIEPRVWHQAAFCENTGELVIIGGVSKSPYDMEEEIAQLRTGEFFRLPSRWIDLKPYLVALDVDKFFDTDHTYKIIIIQYYPESLLTTPLDAEVEPASSITSGTPESEDEFPISEVYEWTGADQCQMDQIEDQNASGDEEPPNANVVPCSYCKRLPPNGKVNINSAGVSGFQYTNVNLCSKCVPSVGIYFRNIPKRSRELDIGPYYLSSTNTTSRVRNGQKSIPFSRKALDEVTVFDSYADAPTASNTISNDVMLSDDGDASWFNTASYTSHNVGTFLKDDYERFCERNSDEYGTDGYNIVSSKPHVSGKNSLKATSAISNDDVRWSGNEDAWFKTASYASHIDEPFLTEGYERYFDLDNNEGGTDEHNSVTSKPHVSGINTTNTLSNDDVRRSGDEGARFNTASYTSHIDGPFLPEGYERYFDLNYNEGGTDENNSVTSKPHVSGINTTNTLSNDDVRLSGDEGARFNTASYASHIDGPFLTEGYERYFDLDNNEGGTDEHNSVTSKPHVSGINTTNTLSNDDVRRSGDEGARFSYGSHIDGPFSTEGYEQYFDLDNNEGGTDEHNSVTSQPHKPGINTTAATNIHGNDDVRRSGDEGARFNTASYASHIDGPFLTEGYEQYFDLDNNEGGTDEHNTVTSKPHVPGINTTAATNTLGNDDVRLSGDEGARFNNASYASHIDGPFLTEGYERYFDLDYNEGGTDENNSVTSKPHVSGINTTNTLSNDDVRLSGDEGARFNTASYASHTDGPFLTEGYERYFDLNYNEGGTDENNGVTSKPHVSGKNTTNTLGNDDVRRSGDEGARFNTASYTSHIDGPYLTEGYERYFDLDNNEGGTDEHNSVTSQPHVPGINTTAATNTLGNDDVRRSGDEGARFNTASYTSHIDGPYLTEGYERYFDLDNNEGGTDEHNSVTSQPHVPGINTTAATNTLGNDDVRRSGDEGARFNTASYASHIDGPFLTEGYERYFDLDYNEGGTDENNSVTSKPHVSGINTTNTLSNDDVRRSGDEGARFNTASYASHIDGPFLTERYERYFDLDYNEGSTDEHNSVTSQPHVPGINTTAATNTLDNDDVRRSGDEGARFNTASYASHTDGPFLTEGYERYFDLDYNEGGTDENNGVTSKPHVSGINTTAATNTLGNGDVRRSGDEGARFHTASYASHIDGPFLTERYERYFDLDNNEGGTDENNSVTSKPHVPGINTTAATNTLSNVDVRRSGEGARFSYGRHTDGPFLTEGYERYFDRDYNEGCTDKHNIVSSKPQASGIKAIVANNTLSTDDVRWSGDEHARFNTSSYASHIDGPFLTYGYERYFDLDNNEGGTDKCNIVSSKPQASGMYSTPINISSSENKLICDQDIAPLFSLAECANTASGASSSGVTFLITDYDSSSVQDRGESCTNQYDVVSPKPGISRINSTSKSNLSPGTNKFGFIKTTPVTPGNPIPSGLSKNALPNNLCLRNIYECNTPPQNPNSRYLNTLNISATLETKHDSIALGSTHQQNICDKSTNRTTRDRDVRGTPTKDHGPSPASQVDTTPARICDVSASQISTKHLGGKMAFTPVNKAPPRKKSPFRCSTRIKTPEVPSFKSYITPESSPSINIMPEYPSLEDISNLGVGSSKSRSSARNIFETPRSHKLRIPASARRRAHQKSRPSSPDFEDITSQWFSAEDYKYCKTPTKTPGIRTPSLPSFGSVQRFAEITVEAIKCISPLAVEMVSACGNVAAAGAIGGVAASAITAISSAVKIGSAAVDAYDKVHTLVDSPKKLY